MTIRQPNRRPHVVPITAPSFPTLPRPQIYRKIAYTFVALVVIVVVGVLWLSSVRADVTVKLKQSVVKLDESMEVARAPKPGQIPGRVVQGVFEKIQDFNTQDLLPAVAPVVTSTAPLMDVAPKSAPIMDKASDQVVRAKGTVRIINKYSKSQTLVKITRLLTPDGKLYRIDKTVVVPAGGEVSVSAYADKTGSEFVIGPTQFTIPGLFVDLQKFIYAVSDTAFVAVPTNEAPELTPPSAPKTTSTPTQKPGTPVTADMVERAQKQLSDLVLAQAKKSLASEVADPKFTDVVYFVKPIEKKSNAVLGQTSDRFLASIKLDVTAVYYSKEDVLALIHAKLKERIPDGREVAPMSDGTIVYSLEAADAKAETASIHLVADTGYRLSESSPGLQKSVIAGKSKDDAIALLKAVEGVQEVHIELHPGWVSKLPTLKDRIDMKIE